MASPGHYQPSKGRPEILIKSMAYPYLKSALAILVRDFPERVDEIRDMRAEMEVREAEREAASSGE